MQAFHKWLSSTNETPSAYKRRMARLARVNRAQIMEIAGELVWFVWDAPEVTNA
jgi:hypothetical protein